VSAVPVGAACRPTISFSNVTTPPVWSETAQDAYLALLQLPGGSPVTAEGGLLKVVLPFGSQPEPAVSFTVTSPLLVAGANVTNCIPAAALVSPSPAPPSRRLLQAAVPITVTTPGAAKSSFPSGTYRLKTVAEQSNGVQCDTPHDRKMCLLRHVGAWTYTVSRQDSGPVSPLPNIGGIGQVFEGGVELPAVRHNTHMPLERPYCV
jgi:hypothetical protein